MRAQMYTRRQFQQKTQRFDGSPQSTHGDQDEFCNRTGEVQAHKSEWLTPPRVGLVKTYLLAFYYAITTLREAPANDLYVFWQVPNRQYG